MSKLMRVIDGLRCEAKCACGTVFVCDRGEDGEPGEDECFDCQADHDERLDQMRQRIS